MLVPTSVQSVSVTNLQNISSVPIGDSVFIDSVFGVDSTGVRTNLVQPFLTITNAMKASRSNDLITSQSGGYNDWGETKSNFVNWYFPPNSTIVVTNADISDAFVIAMAGFIQDSNPIVANVFGEGNFFVSLPTFIATPFQNTAIGALTLEATNSIVTWECNSIICTNITSIGGIGGGINGCCLDLQYPGYANVTANSLLACDYTASFGDGLGQGPCAINYGSGNVQVNIGTITTTNLNALQFNDDSAIQNQAVSVFNIGQIYSHGNSCAIIWYGSTSLGQQEFINCNIIQSDNDAAIANSVGGGDKQYITALKISNHSTTTPVISYANQEGTNQLWLVSQKIQDNLGGGLIGYGAILAHATTNAAAGKMFYTCQQWVVETNSWDAAIKLNGGTHSFFGGNVTIPNGPAFWIGAGGMVTLNNMTIDCSQTSNVTNNPVYFATAGSQNVILNNCTLISAPGINCIGATNGAGQSFMVTLNNCRLNGGIASNVTVNQIGTNYFSSVLVANGSGITNLPDSGILDFRAGETNLTAATTIVVQFSSPLSQATKTNYTVTLEPFLSGITSPDVTVKTTNGFTATFGSFTGDLDYSVTPWH